MTLVHPSLSLPPLNHQLVEQSEMNSDLKNKIRHLLKLSPEKWEEVCQHALAAVVPDFRPRVWWCPNIRSGLLFACKNGSVDLNQHPTGQYGCIVAPPCFPPCFLALK